MCVRKYWITIFWISNKDAIRWLKTITNWEKYIANDVYLDNETQQIIIITGPNMAGKSALLRQTALITLMAQIGCFVPVESARIGVVDKILPVVGASDNISQGESTFYGRKWMRRQVFLNNLSNRSLILSIELGRGTSTYDGISLLWAIVEYIHEHGAKQRQKRFLQHTITSWMRWKNRFIALKIIMCQWRKWMKNHFPA